MVCNLFSSFIQEKNFPRKNWKNWCSGRRYYRIAVGRIKADKKNLPVWEPADFVGQTAYLPFSKWSLNTINLNIRTVFKIVAKIRPAPAQSRSIANPIIKHRLHFIICLPQMMHNSLLLLDIFSSRSCPVKYRIALPFDLINRIPIIK